MSEYTDNVDILTRPDKKAQIIRDQVPCPTVEMSLKCLGLIRSLSFEISVLSSQAFLYASYPHLSHPKPVSSLLKVASDYQEGQRLMKDRDFSQNAEFFQTTFEIGRRFKITNPEKMVNLSCSFLFKVSFASFCILRFCSFK